MVAAPLPPYVDAHTHAGGIERYADRPDVWAVQSVMLGSEEPHPAARFVTMGVHPLQLQAQQWALCYKEDRVEAVAALVAQLEPERSRLIGIGECGWDRRSSLTEAEQTALLSLHIDVAETLRLPLILHCVGGMHQLLAQRSLHRRVPWLLHGFGGKPATLPQLQRHDLCYSHAPMDRSATPLIAGAYLLESDEQPLPIDTLYLTAAERLGCSVAELRVRYFDHFSTLFSRQSYTQV